MKKKKFDFNPHYSLWYVWWIGVVVVITTLTFFRFAIGDEEKFNLSKIDRLEEGDNVVQEQLK